MTPLKVTAEENVETWILGFCCGKFTIYFRIRQCLEPRQEKLLPLKKIANDTLIVREDINNFMAPFDPIKKPNSKLQSLRIHTTLPAKLSVSKCASFPICADRRELSVDIQLDSSNIQSFRTVIPCTQFWFTTG